MPLASLPPPACLRLSRHVRPCASLPRPVTPRSLPVRASCDDAFPPRRYEDWKAKQKDAEAKEAAELEEQDRAMREYRAGLEADRASRLGTGIAVSKARQREDHARVRAGGWMRGELS